MNKSLYLNSPQTTFTKHGNIVKFVVSLSIAFVMLFSSLVAILGTEKAEAVDWNQWLMCSVLGDPAPDLYQFSQSDDFPFLIRSKSMVGASTGSVNEGLLNKILEISGTSFKDINEPIIGYSLDPGEPTDDTSTNDTSTDNTEDGSSQNASEIKAAANYNGGSDSVNLYDRFGVAGMNFTTYAGEWKYIVIDACNTATAPQDPKANLYYEGRLEPRSTFQDINGSKDVRTQQFAKNVFVQYLIAIGDVISNAIFWITKLIVVITITFVGFAFSDIVNTLGVDQLIGGDGGVFSSLFDGIFSPLIYLAFFITAIKIFWEAVVKSQYRAALDNLIRSLALFVIAIVIAAAPAFWISIPNKIAVGAQSIIITTLNGGIAQDEGLCATGIAKQQSPTLVNKEFTKHQDVLDNASENMRSSISCRFWETFLLKPWSQGQFGTDYHKLWAQGKIPDWEAPEKAADLTNVNEEMVGDASVPLGNNEVINNWAFYQLSAQTNVHVATGAEGSPAKYTNGVANDWWRIVDVLANYSEVKKQMTVTGSSAPITGQDSGSVSTSGSYTFPIKGAHKTSDYGYRVHPVTGQKKLHAGIDYSGRTGTQLYAFSDGTAHITKSATAGNILELKSVDGWTYRYLHLSGYDVQEGQQVKSGDPIAKVGATGRVTGPHLHFETVDPSGTTIDTNTRLKELGFNPKDGSGTGAEQTTAPADTSTTSTSSSSQVVEYSVPADNPVLAPWDDWVGNNPINRMWAATSSIVIALIGVSAPLIFSALSTIYAFGIALLMSLAPLMLLLGCWAGKGWEIFKGWAKLLVETTLKRIITGVFMALSLILVTVALKIMDDVGWMTGMMTMILLMVLLIRSRHKIIDMFASINISGADLSSTAGQINNKFMGTTKRIVKVSSRETTKAAVTFASAAAGSRVAGGTLRQGLRSGLNAQARNLTMRSRVLRDSRATFEEHLHSQGNTTENMDYVNSELVKSQQYCEACGRDITKDLEMAVLNNGVFLGGRTRYGGIICSECFEMNVVPDATEFKFQTMRPRKENKKNSKIDKVRAKREKFNSGMTHAMRDIEQRQREYLKESIENNDKYNPHKVGNNTITMSKSILYDIENHRVASNQHINEKNPPIINTPKIPDYLEPYLSGSSDLLFEAWRTQNYSVIKKMYTAANYAYVCELLYDNNRKISLSYDDLLKIINDPAEEQRIRDRVRGGQ